MDIAKIRKKARSKGEGSKGRGPRQPEQAAAPPEPPGKGLPAEGGPGAAEAVEIQTVEESAPPQEAEAPPWEGEDDESPAIGDAEAESRVDLLIFRIDGEEYAFRVSDVQEIHKTHMVTRVPTAGTFVLGVISLRGTIVPVVDLRARLTGRPLEGTLQQPKIIILRGPLGPVGVIASERMRFESVPEASLRERPATLDGPEALYVEKVAPLGDRFVFIVGVRDALTFTVAPEAQ